MTAQTLECEVLTVDGGPAGLSVATTLPDHVSTIIVHQDAEIGKPVRTSGGCWLDDVERLGIPSEFYQVMHQLDVYSDNKEAHFQVKDNKLVVLNITDLYHWIAQKSDHKQRQLMLSTKFLSTTKTEDGGHLSTIRSRHTETTQIKSKYIIDCSGVRNAVLDDLSLKEKPDRTGVGIEYEYPIGTNKADHAILFVGSSVLSGYGWVFPTADGKLRVGVGVIHPDTDVSPKKLMLDFLASDDVQRFGLDLTGEYDVSAGTLPSVAYDPGLVFGNVIRVGDSANFATPTVGEGIRICMDHGEALGRALGETICTNDPAPLKRYESDCKKALARNYHFGFLTNKRFSLYSAKDWDKSIRRISHLRESELVALLRSEFTAKMILKATYKMLKQKLFEPS